MTPQSPAPMNGMRIGDDGLVFAGMCAVDWGSARGVCAANVGVIRDCDGTLNLVISAHAIARSTRSRMVWVRGRGRKDGGDGGEGATEVGFFVGLVS